LTTVEFAEGSQLESIGESSFRGTGITEIVIPANVKTIGNRAFQNCANLEKVTFLSGEANMPDAAGFATGSTTTPFAGLTGVQAYGYTEATAIKTFIENYYMPTTSGLRLGWTWNSMGAVPKHAVSFDSSGGSDVTTQNVAAGGYATNPTTPTKSGFSFSGWYVSIDGGTTFEDNAFDFSNFTITEDLILYAKWAAGPATGLPGSGDYNGDGMVTATDIIAARQAAIGSFELSESQFDALDINGDSIITATDILRIRQIAIGQ
jgi:Listeria-Bacteroides repeat domain (List_Bact_rpt).